MNIESLASQVVAFHDAVLVAVDLRWQNGRTTVALQTVGGPRQIVVDSTASIQGARQMPWGWSVCVNAITLAASPQGVQLEIEMQSGDKIQIIGSRVSLD